MEISCPSARISLSVYVEFALSVLTRAGIREFNAVPLRRHDWHGDWNYTNHGSMNRAVDSAARSAIAERENP